jgi:hypothetical protein
LLPALLAAPSTRADSTEALLTAIKGVGKEGKGNAEAATAWKELTAQGLQALLPTLRAMDDDDVISSNWLRAAADAIAEQALKQGKPLPVKELEQFLGEAKQSAQARRIAYEWLVQVDPTAPDRWLPRFLNDPSVELRRDTVAHILRTADEQFSKIGDMPTEDDRKILVAAYSKALSSAVNKDQVDQADRQLKKLGVEVDLAEHFGFVRTWHLIAPFDNTNMAGFDVAYPPEKKVDLKAVYRGKDGAEAKWVSHTTNDPYGMVDLNKALAKHKGAIAYAHAVINSPEERPIEIRAGSITSIKVFLNGKQVFARDEYHHGMRLDQYVSRATLKKGRNELLIKVCQNEQTEEWAQDWKFQVRLCDRVGVAVPFEVVATK